MKEKKTIFLIIIPLVLASCDPIHTLAVYNATDRVRHIEVQGIVRDSIPIQKTEVNSKLGNTNFFSVESKDEGKSGYTFIIGPGWNAYLEIGFGPKPLIRKVIIDGTDTIQIKKSAVGVKKRPFFAIGGNYVLKLKD